MTPRSQSPTKPTARLSAQDWIDAATDALRRGVAAVAVEPLAASLGVTRGSFYAHFDSRDDLLRAALERWRSSEMAEPQDLDVSDPRDRLARHLEHMFGDHTSGEIHAQLCAAAEDPIVGPVHVELALAKTAKLADLYHQAGLVPGSARTRAVVTYTAYIGFWRAVTALPNIAEAQALGASPEMFDGYLDHVMDLLIPPPTSIRPPRGT